MSLKKGIFSLSIAATLVASTLVVPSISVYAANCPKAITVKNNISINKALDKTSKKVDFTTSRLKATSKVTAVGVYDSVHNMYIAVADQTVQGASGAYYVGIIYTSADKVNWTAKIAPKMAVITSIATDGKGDVVIGGRYAYDVSITDYVFTTNDGGASWSETLTGDRMFDASIGNPTSGTYLGTNPSVTYSNNQFVATGDYGTTVYSSDGYNWHN